MAIAFEQNKRDLLSKIEELKAKAKAEADIKEKAEVIVYGAKSVFLDGLIEVMAKKFTVKYFNNSEEASMYCQDHLASRLVLDMDQPTDWKSSTDVFTTVKMVRPDMRIFVCTKNPDAVPVQTLVAQKAAVLTIPFSVDTLFHNLKEKT
jgi:hypothetical protein